MRHSDSVLVSSGYGIGYDISSDIDWFFVLLSQNRKLEKKSGDID